MLRKYQAWTFALPSLETILFYGPPLLHQIDGNIIMFVYTACFQHADEILWKSRPNLQ